MKTQLKLPLYNDSSSPKNSDVNGKRTCHQSTCVPVKAPAYGVESSIEIQWNHCNARVLAVSILLASWLPLVFLIFFVHNSASVSVENQITDMNHLKMEIKSLSEELHLLRSLLMSNLPLSVEDSLLSSGQDIRAERLKRGVAEDMKSNMKELSPPQQKFQVSSSSRRGKVSRRKHRPAQILRRHQCPRCSRRNDTLFSALQAVHLRGAHPETVVENGHVGPWFIDSKAVKDSNISSAFQLREDGDSVEIKDSGLYFIYAQVYYLTSHALNSFSIVLLPKDSESEVTLALCSSNAMSGSITSELSCYTATLHALQAGDRIYVEQREKHRRLIMRSGHSFLGFVKLNSS